MGDYWNNTNTGLRVQFSLNEAGGAYIIRATCSGSGVITTLASVGVGQIAGAKVVDVNQVIVESITGRSDDETFNVFIVIQDNSGTPVDTLNTPTNIEFQETSPQSTSTPVLSSLYDSGISNSDGITQDTSVTIYVEDITSGLRVSTDFIEDKLAGQNIGIEPSSDGSNQSYTIDLSAGDGYYTIQSTTRNNYGSEGTSGKLYLYVDTQAPSAPSVFNLIDDTGYSDSDWLTYDPDPQFGIKNIALHTWLSNGFWDVYGRALLYRNGSAQADSVLEINDDDSVVVTIPTISNDGTYQIQAQIVDAAGNRGPRSSQVALRLDRQADQTDRPILKSTSDSGFGDSDEWTNDDTPTFTITGFDVGDSIYVTINDVFKVGSWTTTGTLDLTIPDGSALTDEVDISIEAVAVDSAGNESVISPELTITVDTVIPVASATPNLTDDTGILTDDDYTNVTKPGFTVTAEDASDSVFLYFDGTLVARRVAGAATLTFETADYLAAQSDGDYSVTYKLRDKAGNLSSASSSLEITIDNSTPDPPLSLYLRSTDDSGSSNSDGVTSEREPRFDLQFSADHVSDADSVIIKIGGIVKAKGLIDLPSMTFQTEVLNSGTHTVAATIIDSAGNVSSDLSGQSLTIDYNSPIPEAEDEPDLQADFDTGFSSSDGITKATNLTFTISNVTEGDSVYLFFNTDTVARGKVTESGATTIDLDVIGYAEGNYSVGYRLRDLAGNLGPASLLEDLWIDRTASDQTMAPDLIDDSDTGLLSNDNLTNDPTPVFYIDSLAQDSISLLFNAEIIKTEYNSTGSDITITAPVKPHGNYLVTVQATDAAGNTSDVSPPLAIEIDLDAPGEPAIPSLIPADDSGFLSNDGRTNVIRPSFFLADLPTDKLDYIEIFRADTVLLAENRMSNFGTMTIQSTADLGRGTHSITAVVTDSAGNFRASQPYSLFIETESPAAPDSVNLLADSDSGTRNDDNETKDLTPSFKVFDVANGDSVFIVMTQGATKDTVGRKYASATFVNITCVNIGAIFDEGEITVSAFTMNIEGNTSAVSSSGSLIITLDTSNLETPTIVLKSDSDTGTSDSDRLTRDITPTFTVGDYQATDSLYLIIGTDTIARGYSELDEVDLTTTTTLTTGTYSATALSRDYAGNLSNSSAALSFRIDRNPPDQPATPNLIDADDTGVSSIDDTTSVNQPSFVINGLPDNSLDLVELYRDSDSLLASVRMTTFSTLTVQSTVELLSDTYPITVLVIDSAGNSSPVSDPLTITIITDPPSSPTNIELIEASDSGTRNDDRITSDITPTFTVSGVTAGDSIYLVMEQGSITTITDTVGSGFSNGATINITADDISGIFSDGTITVRAYAMNVAGKTSAVGSSAALAFTLDTSNLETPTIVLKSDSDTGTSDSDRLTRDITPTFTVGDYQATDSLYLIIGTDTIARGYSELDEVDLTTTTTLTTGTYSATALSRDYAGNLSNSSAALSFRIDRNPPDQPATPNLIDADDTGVSSIDDTTSVNQPSFVINGLPDNSLDLVELYRDSDSLLASVRMTTFSTLTVQSTVELLSDTYPITVLVIDSAGNSSPVSDPLTITIITDPPSSPTNIELIEASDSGTRNDDRITSDITPTFTVSGVTAGDSIYLVMEQGSITTITDTVGSGFSNGATINITADDISGIFSDGTITVRAYAMNVAGKTSAVGSSAALAFTLDTSNLYVPVIVLISDSGISSNDRLTNDTTPTFTVTDIVDTDSLYLVIGIDTLVRDQSDGISFNLTSTALNNGTYQAKVLSRDYAGNISAASTVLSIRIDTQAPAQPATPDLLTAYDSGFFDDDDITSDTRPAFVLTGLSTVRDSIILTLDGPTTSNTRSVISQGVLDTLQVADILALGTYTASVVAIDSAGNQSTASSELTIDINTLFPSTPIAPDLLPAFDTGQESIDNLTNINEPQFSIGNLDNGTLVRLYSVAGVDTTLIAADTLTDGSNSIILTSTELVDGLYNIFVTSQDTAGNTSQSGNLADFRLDTKSPSALIALSDSLVKALDVSVVTVQFSDGMTSSPTIRVDYVDGDSLGTTFLSNAGQSSDSTWFFNVTIPDSNDGTATITISGEDNAGNSMPADSVFGINLLKLDNTDPLFQDFNIDTSDYIKTKQLGWTLTEDLVEGQISFSWISGPVGSFNSTLDSSELLVGVRTPAILTSDPNLSDGAKYGITFSGTDSAGNQASYLVDNVTYDITPPSVSFTYSHYYTTADTVVNISAEFSEKLPIDPPIQIATNNGSGSTFNGTMTSEANDSTNFEYLWTTPSGTSNEGIALITLTATDLATNALSPDSTFFRNMLIVDSSPVTVTFEYENLDQPQLTNLGHVGDSVRITARFNDQMRKDAEAPTLNIQYADSTDDSIVGQLYSSKSNGDSTWVYEIILPDSSKNSGIMTVSAIGLDFAGNSVTTALLDAVFEVDNTPPAAFATGAVTTVVGNNVTGWINGSNDSLKIKAPIFIADLDGTVRLAFAVPAKMDTASFWAIAGDPIDLTRAADPDSFYVDIDTIITALNDTMSGDLEQGDEILTWVIKYDEVGNNTRGQVSSQNLFYDVLPPVAGSPLVWNSTSPDTLISNDSLQIVWGAYSDPVAAASGIERYEWAVETGGPGWSEFIGWTSTLIDTSVDTALALTHASIYRIKLRTFDVAGNQSTPDQITTSFLRLNSAPVITPIDSTVVYEDVQYIDTVQITDLDLATINGDAFSYQLGVSHQGGWSPVTPATIDPAGIITWTPAPQDTGIYDYTVYVNDNWGFSDTLEYVLSTLPVNDAPIADFRDTSLVLVEDSLRVLQLYLNPFVTDEDNLIPDLDWYRVVILDTVDNPGYPEIGYNYPPGDASTGQITLMKQYPVNHVSGDNVPDAFNWAANPPLTVDIATSNDSTIATITADSNYFGKLHRLIFMVRDPDLATDLDTVLLEVESRNDPPVLSVISDQSILENDSLKLDLGSYAYDVDDSTLTFQVQALVNPDSITISDSAYVSSGLGDTIVFTPKPLWSDSTIIRVIVIDDSDAADTVQFTLDIIRVDRPHLAISIIQNSVFTNHFEIIVNDTIQKTVHCDVTVDGDTVNLDTVAAYNYIGRTEFDTNADFTISAYAQGQVGDTTVTRDGTVVLARANGNWTGASPDGRFRLTGKPGIVHSDQPILIIDSTLFNSAVPSQAAYRIGPAGMPYDNPILLTFADANDQLAIYLSADGATWQELPTITAEDKILAWTTRSGYFKLGDRHLFVPDETALRSNYPNPFNPSTTIVYDLGFTGGPDQNVNITIFDLLGRQVVEIFDGQQIIGRHEIRWDSRNARGIPSASGIYFIRMTAEDNFVKTHKITLLR